MAKDNGNQDSMEENKGSIADEPETSEKNRYAARQDQQRKRQKEKAWN